MDICDRKQPATAPDLLGAATIKLQKQAMASICLAIYRQWPSHFPAFSHDLSAGAGLWKEPVFVPVSLVHAVNRDNGHANLQAPSRRVVLFYGIFCHMSLRFDNLQEQSKSVLLIFGWNRWLRKEGESRGNDI